MPVNPQPAQVSRWENVTWKVTMDNNGSIAGQTFQLNIRDQDGNVVDTRSPGTITDAGSNTTPGVVVFVEPSDLTGTFDPTDYAYDIWRIDAGFEERLVYGNLSVLPEQWK